MSIATRSARSLAAQFQPQRSHHSRSFQPQLTRHRGRRHPTRRQAVAGWSAAAAAAAATTAAATARVLARSIAFVPPVCFDADCAARADASFLVAIAVPLLLAAAAGAWALQPPPQELRDSGRVFEDPSTGTLFEAPEGVRPEVDKDVRARAAWGPLKWV
jgi:hypothetical protein